MRNIILKIALAAAMLVSLPAMGKTYYFDNYSVFGSVYREVRIIIDENMMKMTVKMQTASMKWQTAELEIVKKEQMDSHHRFEAKDSNGSVWTAEIYLNDEYICLYNMSVNKVYRFSSPYKVIR